MADVLPFKKRGKPEPEPKPAPVSDVARGLHPKARRARPEAQELAARQAGEQHVRYLAAQTRQEVERLITEGRVVPARITLALDYGGHEGPEVDIACGAVEPAVDLWECGVETPTREQVRLLSELTGFPEHYFYMPIKPGPLLEQMIVCWGGRRGCESVQTYVDERGVLHYDGERRTPPESYQSALF